MKPHAEYRGDFSLPQNGQAVGAGADLGDPYPWDLGIYTTVSLKDHNRTLRFQSAGKAAQGYYTCLVSNGSFAIARTTQLKVDGKNFVTDLKS